MGPESGAGQHRGQASAFSQRCAWLPCPPFLLCTCCPHITPSSCPWPSLPPSLPQAYGRELDEAYEWCLKYKQSRKEAELHQAWDLYYHVFKRINKQLPSLTTLELQYVAPALVRAQGLELAVPGTYIAGEPLVTIAAFAPQLHVITSKQRPRKLTIHGSDGAEYMFLLKGHEDLRQDERVMQLFGLVNNMLATDRVTAERDLTIARYAVIPLSPNSGLIGWVAPGGRASAAQWRSGSDLLWGEAAASALAVDRRCAVESHQPFEPALSAGPAFLPYLWPCGGPL